MKRYLICQGTSCAVIVKPDYASAIARAAYIGFGDPDKVRLIDPGEDWEAVARAEYERRRAA